MTDIRGPIPQSHSAEPRPRLATSIVPCGDSDLEQGFYSSETIGNSNSELDILLTSHLSADYAYPGSLILQTCHASKRLVHL